MGIEGSLSSLPGIMGMLPVLLQVSQLVANLFFIWFFGSFAMKGFRGKKPYTLKLAGTVLAGTLNLLAAAAFAGFVPFLGSGLFSLLQLDMLAAGIAVSIVLAVALSLITHEKAALRPEELAEKLKMKVKALEEMLRKKEGRLSEKEAGARAEEALNGYHASGSKLVGNEYQVKLAKGKDEATVALDAWDGEILSIIRHKPAMVLFATDPRKMAGLAIIAALAIGTAILFEGFPDPVADIASMFGMSAGELSDMTERAAESPLLGGGVPEGCISYAVFMDYYGQLADSDFMLDHIYEDDAISRSVGSGCGQPQAMFRMDHEGRELVIALTEDGKVAYMTDGKPCACIDVMGQ